MWTISERIKLITVCYILSWINLNEIGLEIDFPGVFVGATRYREFESRSEVRKIDPIVC